MTINHRRRTIFQWVSVTIGVFLALTLTEVALRISGYRPARYITETTRPVMNEPDAVLGWQSLPGEYVDPPYSEEGRPTRITILPNHSRTTGTPPGANGPLVVVVGCSYTYGAAVSDDDTFAWKLQQAHPELRVENHGTIGYGTYQSLLRLERLYASGEAPAFVIYGFIDDHERRNVAPWWWLKFLGTYSNRKHVDVPYCTLDRANRLVRHEPARFLMLPLREQLAVVPLLEEGYMGAISRGRNAQGRAVTEWLISEMAELCRAHGTRFMVAMLGASEEATAHYSRYFSAQGIRSVDCTFPFTPSLRVVGDGHPNEQAHGRYQSCIEHGLRDQSTW